MAIIQSWKNFHIIVGFIALLTVFNCISVAESEVSCFECSSVNDTYCPEFMTNDDESVVPMNSCKYVHQGEYCIKETGVTAGSLGTRRFCSSRDMGNYCEYIRRPGDPHEYRSCVFTCSSDGCNPGVTLHPNFQLYGYSFSLVTVLAYIYRIIF